MLLKQELCLIGIATLSMVGSLGIGAAYAAAPIPVDCTGDADALATAVDDAAPGDKFKIDGVCNGVEIKTDDLTLVGKTSAEVSGTIIVKAARRVTIKKLKVTGPGAGVVAERNASITVKTSDISANEGIGILLDTGAYGDIIGNDIEDNGGSGIRVFNGAVATLKGNDIKNNGDKDDFEAGIELSRAVVRSEGDNIIDGNGWAGISIFNSSAFRNGAGGSPDTITQTAPGTFAVAVGRGSTGDFRNAAASGDVDVALASTLEFRGNVDNGLNGAITVSNGSTANIRRTGGPPFILGSLSVTGNSTATVRGASIANDVAVSSSSHALFDQSTISGSIGSLSVTGNSTATVRGASIANDVAVSSSSHALFDQSTISGSMSINSHSVVDLISGSSLLGSADLFGTSSLNLAAGVSVVGVVNADLQSTVVGDPGSIIALRRSVVVGAASGSVTLFTESAADDAAACDDSSTVFTGSINLGLPCLSFDLRNILERIEFLEGP